MPSSTPFRIVICGGGIAGMSAAIALRAPGREITILEQSRLASEIGATISLQPNASRILQKEWKVDSLHSARGMIDQGFRILNTDGELVTSVPLTAKTEYGGDRVMYHRQDLHTCLQRAVLSDDREGHPAVIRTSSRVINCDPQQGLLTLEDGEQLYADLIVAADGIHSAIRKSVVGEVAPQRTGLSAYRFMLSTETIEKEVPEFCAKVEPRQPFTTMVMAHDCRLIMGPAREGSVYSFVGLVPDTRMNEDSDSKQSWTSKGDVELMLETFKDYPEWIKSVFKLSSKELGLWQLRDIDPLDTWTKGRVILIGDAAHAMLPTQGQGASQAVEDAEALGAFFEGFATESSRHQPEQVESILQQISHCRRNRAALIQQYSREAARPATSKDNKKILMRPDEFMDYNCLYKGAKAWVASQDTAAMV